MLALRVILIIFLVILILYLLMIRPRLFFRPDRRPFMKVLYAHRGLHNNASDAPENSMAAFRKAVQAGFGIELDIQLTKDRIPVVFHDFTLQRVCGEEGRVSDYTYEELQRFHLFSSQQTIPKLEDVLGLVNGKVPLIIELKIEFLDNSLCPIADQILSRYEGAYCIESFNPMGVYWYRRNRPEILRGQLSDGFLKEGEYTGFMYWILQNLLMNCLGKPDFIAYNHKYAGNLSRKLCHGLYRGLAAAWTIKSEEELERAQKHFDIFIFDSFLPTKEDIKRQKVS